VLELSNSNGLVAIESSVNNTRIRSNLSLPNTLNYYPFVYLDRLNKVAFSVGENFTAISVNGSSNVSIDDNSVLINFIKGLTTISMKRFLSIEGVDYRNRLIVKYKSATAAELDLLTAQ